MNRPAQLLEWSLPDEIEDRGRLPAPRRLTLGAGSFAQDPDLEGLICANMSFADFLAFEEGSDHRHEYVRGRVYAMAGADDAHNTITGNIFALFHAAVRGSGCRAFTSEMALRISDEASYYPDVMVTCSSNDAELKQFKREPTLLVEVLSKSTSGKDRGAKKDAYLDIPSLRQYWLVSKDRRQIEVYERVETGWLRSLIQAGTIVVPGVQGEFSLDRVYEDVALAADVP